MDKERAKSELETIANLAKFSKDSKIPLRTLHRIKSGEGEHIRTTTLMLLASALKRLRPARKGDFA